MVIFLCCYSSFLSSNGIIGPMHRVPTSRFFPGRFLLLMATKIQRVSQSINSLVEYLLPQNSYSYSSYLSLKSHLCIFNILISSHLKTTPTPPKAIPISSSSPSYQLNPSSVPPFPPFPSLKTPKNHPSSSRPIQTPNSPHLPLNSLV